MLLWEFRCNIIRGCFEKRSHRIVGITFTRLFRLMHYFVAASSSKSSSLDIGPTCGNIVLKNPLQETSFIIDVTFAL